jgi:hypothetical protein
MADRRQVQHEEQQVILDDRARRQNGDMQIALKETARRPIPARLQLDDVDNMIEPIHCFVVQVDIPAALEPERSRIYFSSSCAKFSVHALHSVSSGGRHIFLS